MCTVTFLPQGENIFITSNRDENPSRQAERLTTYHTRESNIHYPLDTLSDGSWIALSDTGRAICLLNGAYQAFIPKPPYRVSRGKVVIQACMADSIDQFLHEYELSGIAPFTLLAYEDHSLKQLIWDGDARNIESLPADQPRIWSSVTLYPPDVRAWRKSFFDQWLIDHTVFNRESILAFHQQANGDPTNDFIMNRHDIVKTLSITNIVLQPDSGSILHLDLERKEREEILIQHGR